MTNTADPFSKGDTVYTQDGTNYYFDHVAGNHGYVSPIIITQITNYHGDDFEEHEEVADHMIPVPLDKLSKTPWHRKVDEETQRLLAERKAALDDLNRQIGAARTAKFQAENELKMFEKDKENVWRDLKRRYAHVTELDILLNGKERFMILWDGDGVPSEIRSPRHLQLCLDDEDGTYKYGPADYYDREDGNVFVFPNEHTMHMEVLRIFQSQERTPEEELTWQYHWPIVPLSKEAQELQQARANEKRERAIKKVCDNLTRAQEEYDKVMAGEDVSPPHAPAMPDSLL